MKNIVLIGMSGSGKTSVGEYISGKLDMEFIDTDNILITRNKMDISHIFDRYGEDYFRRMEGQLIREICPMTESVISTGGGIILCEDNIKLLRQNGIIFFLKGEVDTLIRNLQTSSLNHRPLLAEDGALGTQISRMYKDRKELYLNSADIIIPIDNRAIEKVGNCIVDQFLRIAY
ncbi:MAG: shikimate kinase [Tissierellia bacterium]|nr:shikimate kinase [Tissierellia bacterium]